MVTLELSEFEKYKKFCIKNPKVEYFTNNFTFNTCWSEYCNNELGLNLSEYEGKCVHPVK